MSEVLVAVDLELHLPRGPGLGLEAERDLGVFAGIRARRADPITMRLAEPPEPRDLVAAHDAPVMPPLERATDREVVVVAAVLAAGLEKAAVHRLGLAHSTVKHHLATARSKVGATTTAQLAWILAPRWPAPEGLAPADD